MEAEEVQRKLILYSSSVYFTSPVLTFLMWRGVSQYNRIKAKITPSGGDGSLLLQTPGCCEKVSTSHSSNLTLGSVQDQLGLQPTGSWTWPRSWSSPEEEPEQQQKGRSGETVQRRCGRDQTEEVQEKPDRGGAKTNYESESKRISFDKNQRCLQSENTSKSYFNFHSSAESLTKYTRSTTAIYFHSVLLAGLNSHTLAQTLLQN